MPHKLECHVALPNPMRAGEHPRLPGDVAILLGTPVGSLIYPNGDTLSGDTGVRAQALANEFGTKVIAWQDLGPKVNFPGLLAARRQMSGNNFTEYAQESAEILADTLAAEGIGRVVMRVHSGTGPLGTELTLALDNQDGLAVTHLAISDPVGMQRVSFLEGWRRMRTYRDGSAKNAPEDHRNEPGHPPNTRASFLSDVVVRGTTIWLTDSTYKNLINIARNQLGTATRLHLPGNTLNGSPAQMRDLAQHLDSLTHRTDGTFIIDFAPTDHHSSEYDRLIRNANFIRKTIALSRL
jgi:hypothetical protein